MAVALNWPRVHSQVVDLLLLGDAVGDFRLAAGMQRVLHVARLALVGAVLQRGEEGASADCAKAQYSYERSHIADYKQK